MARRTTPKSGSSANLGFEQNLWSAAGKLRHNMDAAESERGRDSQPPGALWASNARQYKHLVLGLIFLKYISDSFEKHHAKLVAGEGDFAGANPEDPDEPSGARQTGQPASPKGERVGANQYHVENIFWVPPAARWSSLQSSAKPPTIGNNDPACSSGGISICGQDKWARGRCQFGLAPRARRVRLRQQQPKQSNATTRRLAIMNLVNPPFNDSDWCRKADDVRWPPNGERQIANGNSQGERGSVHQFAVPPKGNANFAWVQHFIHHLARFA